MGRNTPCLRGDRWNPVGVCWPCLSTAYQRGGPPARDRHDSRDSANLVVADARRGGPPGRGRGGARSMGDAVGPLARQAAGGGASEMRRGAGAIVVFLLLGAAINVAAAWGCALWSPVDRVVHYGAEGEAPPRALSGMIEPAWLVPSLPERDVLTWGDFVDRGIGVDSHWFLTMERPSAPDSHVFFGVMYLVIAHRAGWPALALECDRSGAWTGEEHPWQKQWRHGLIPPVFAHALSGRGDGSNPIPLRPIWPGFALNTLLYGAACWTLVSGPCTLRRWRRVRRGSCLACGYPVVGLGRCPECGREEGVGGAGSDPGATTRRTRSSSP